MTNIYRIFKKEMSSYLNSPSSYVFLIIFLILGPAMFFFVNQFFKREMANMGGFFMYIPWLFLFFVPAIAMRIWAEEKRSGTDELLMTMPVRDHEVVLGKYLAALALLFFAMVLTFPIPLIVKHFAVPDTIDWGPIWCGYLGSFLLGASILAIGTWCSSLTVNQIIAFILGCTISFVLLIIGIPDITTLLPPAAGEFIGRLSLITHFTNMYRRVIAASDLVYYLSLIAIFLFLNVRSVESRKWM